MGARAKARTQARRENPKLTADGREVVSASFTRYIHCAPRKVALLADLIRGKRVDEALDVLRFSQRPSALPYVERALLSARANAVNAAPEPGELVIAEVRVEGAPMMKRMRAASMGRSVRIRKRLSHLVIFLTEN